MASMINRLRLAEEQYRERNGTWREEFTAIMLHASTKLSVNNNDDDDDG